MISNIFNKIAAGKATGGKEARAAMLVTVAAVPIATVTTCSAVILRRMYLRGMSDVANDIHFGQRCRTNCMRVGPSNLGTLLSASGALSKEEEFRKNEQTVIQGL